MPVIATVLLTGIVLGMIFSTGLFSGHIFPLNSMNMNQNLLLVEIGSMRARTGMSGCHEFTITPGGPIIMGDGCGTRPVAGPGFPTPAGDGVSAITADGTGGLAWGGTGSRLVLGALHGFTGTLDTTTSRGVRSAIMAILLSFSTTLFMGVGETATTP